MSPNDTDRMGNSVDPDQTAPLEPVWSGSALFAQTYLSENLWKLWYRASDGVVGWGDPPWSMTVCLRKVTKDPWHMIQQNIGSIFIPAVLPGL